MTEENIEVNAEPNNAAINEQILIDGINQFKALKNGESQDEVDEETVNLEQKPNSKGKFVKIEDPEVQEKFNQVWKQARASDEANKSLRQHAESMEKALEIAIGKLDRIESRQQKSDSQLAISRLRTQLREARDLGDSDLESNLEDQILEIKLEEKTLANQKKEMESRVKSLQSQQPEPKQEQAYTDVEQKYVIRMASEKDEDGNAIRPWLSSSDKDYDKAVELGGVIAVQLHRERGVYAPITDVIALLDKEMAKGSKSNPQKQQNVLSGRNLTRNINNGKLDISSEQRFMMDRLNIKRLGIDDKTYAKRSSLLAKAHSVSIDDFE